MSDAWFADVAAGTFFAAPRIPEPSTACPEQVDEADPLLIVGMVMQFLTARGVNATLDGTVDRAVEAATRLLRCLDVEATDPWAVTR